MFVGRSIFFSVFFVFGSLSAAASPSMLDGGQWTLTHVNGRAVRDSKAYLEIDAAGRRFSGNAGCNRMFGKVSIDRKRIEFSQVGTTRMMCPQILRSPSEAEFLESLQNASSYTIKQAELILKNRSGRKLLRFTRVIKLPPVVDTPHQSKLGERKWILESIKGVGAVVPKGEIFVSFDTAKSGIGGNSGCNVFGGEYSVSGSKIEIKELISTMRACVEDGRMSVERRLYDGFRTATRFEIRDEKLFLYNGKELLLTFRGAKK